MFMKKIIFCFCIISLISSNSFGAIIQDTLFLNRDTVTMGNLPVNRCVLNDSITFNKTNANIQLEIGDILQLTIYNQDTVEHSFGVVNISTLGTISAGGNSTYSIPFNDFGTFGIVATDPIGNLLGAFAVIRVGLMNEQSFIWNLWDIKAELSHEIGDGTENSIPVDYRPNVYTINGEVYPETTTDPIGAVTGNVNDTIYISIVNSGNMVHTLHFHGYHFTFIQATLRTHVINWEKDSTPMLQNETVTIRLIPDKEGMYPVHDHNLISVLTQNTYPGGMITVLNIQP